jgi:hypothetical protein
VNITVFSSRRIYMSHITVRWGQSRTVIIALLCAIAFVIAEVPAGASGNAVVKGKTDTMTIDKDNREIVITSLVTKDCSKAAVCDWGSRGQAFFGTKGGKAEPFFIFTTDVNRTEIDKALKGLGIKARRQLQNKSETERTGLKATTVKEDYLDGDPMMVVIRYSKGKETVEVALEDLIEEKITVDGKEVIKPYTPHFVYHGTAEVLQYASGCVVCPSGCYGGIIADNSVPLLTTTSKFRVNWEKMPAPGTKAEVVLKSLYSPVRKAAK